jgi:hypothetical protein
VPTDHGSSRLRKTQNGHLTMSVTGPLNLYGQRWEWDSTCCPGVCRDGRAWESTRHDRSL